MGDTSNITIEDATYVSKKWHPGFERVTRSVFGKVEPVEIEEIVIHGTGGLGTFEWVRDGGRRSEYVKGIALFHYIVEYDLFKIRQIAPTERWYYHSSSGKHDMYTIGIELENPHKTNGVPYTDDQYTLLIHLIFNELLVKYPSIKRIVSHNHNIRKYSNSSKSFCPGKYFEWGKLEEELKSRSLPYSRTELECIELIEA